MEKGKISLPWNKFEAVMIPQALYPTMPAKNDDSIEVFVNNFIGATNNAELTNLLRLSRCMLHSIHAIFTPSGITQNQGGDSVPENKLDKGDGTCAYKK